MTSFSGSLYGACFLPPILLGIYWRRGNGAAVIGSFIVGLTCLILWKPLGGVVVSLQGIHQVFPAIFLSVAVYTGIAAWGEARMSEGARKFFQA
jgi:Na+/pantothenate symporter